MLCDERVLSTSPESECRSNDEVQDRAEETSDSFAALVGRLYRGGAEYSIMYLW